jgi:phospholipid transport system substrate-binding protein
VIRTLLAAAFFSLCAITARAEPVAPDMMVLNTANEVLEIIKNDKDIQAGNQAKFSAMLEEKILPHFDLDRIPRIMLGKYWDEATKEQQQAFVREFIAFISRIYASGLSEYHNQTVKCEPPRERPGKTDVMVKMLILQPGNDPGQVDFGLGKTGDEWKIYDVVIDGVSLMVTYRGQFLPLVKQSGMDGLIQKLAEKNQQPSSAVTVSKAK